MLLRRHRTSSQSHSQDTRPSPKLTASSGILPLLQKQYALRSESSQLEPYSDWFCSEETRRKKVLQKLVREKKICQDKHRLLVKQSRDLGLCPPLIMEKHYLNLYIRSADMQYVTYERSQ